MATDSYHYIIIGAGSAGCVLAARLTENPQTRVLLLEAGGANNSLLVRMPAGVAELIKSKNPQNWGFWTEPEPHLNNRRLWWPRGRGLGGSSAINGMVYIRGHARDYDQWRQMGLRGWSYEDVLPYFRKSESHHAGATPFHGAEGPLHISAGESDSPFHDAFIAAGAQAGHPTTPDFNGAQQEGFGRYDLTIHNGKRESAAAAYLAPILSRPNLTIQTGARTTRILLQAGRAHAVEYVTGRRRQPRIAHAEAEILLCAGAVQSPQILQLSGIGAPADLRPHNIPILHESPGVGSNLQDHLDVSVCWATQNLVTGHSMTRLGAKIATGLNYALFGRGPGRQQFLEAGAFLKSREGLESPDLQIHAVLAIMQDHGKIEAGRDGFTQHVCQLRPESRGHVRLRSPDPFDDPAIAPNYLATHEDRRALRTGIRLARDVAAQAALAPYKPSEYAPGPQIQSDAELDEWIAANGETIYHPVGTCKMGDVVDEQLRVIGLEALRVIDASVMPTLISGNTNAPTIMIAERAADLIRGSRSEAVK